LSTRTYLGYSVGAGRAGIARGGGKSNRSGRILWGGQRGRGRKETIIEGKVGIKRPEKKWGKPCTQKKTVWGQARGQGGGERETQKEEGAERFSFNHSRRSSAAALRERSRKKSNEFEKDVVILLGADSRTLG